MSFNNYPEGEQGSFLNRFIYGTNAFFGLPPSPPPSPEIHENNTNYFEAVSEYSANENWVCDLGGTIFEMDLESIEPVADVDVYGGGPSTSACSTEETVQQSAEGTWRESHIENVPAAVVCQHQDYKCKEVINYKEEQIKGTGNRGRPPKTRKQKQSPEVTESQENGDSKPFEFKERVKRVRGRPRGKPPKLNLEQRRERNAQLERERRAELADAYCALRVALGGTSVGPSQHDDSDDLTRENLLVEALRLIKQPSPAPDIADIRRQNELLMRQIEMLEGGVEVTS